LKLEIKEGQYLSTRCHRIGSDVKWGALYTLNNWSCKYAQQKSKDIRELVGYQKSPSNTLLTSRTIIWTLFVHILL